MKRLIVLAALLGAVLGFSLALKEKAEAATNGPLCTEEVHCQYAFNELDESDIPTFVYFPNQETAGANETLTIRIDQASNLAAGEPSVQEAKITCSEFNSPTCPAEAYGPFVEPSLLVYLIIWNEDGTSDLKQLYQPGLSFFDPEPINFWPPSYNPIFGFESSWCRMLGSIGTEPPFFATNFDTIECTFTPAAPDTWPDEFSLLVHIEPEADGDLTQNRSVRSQRITVQ